MSVIKFDKDSIRIIGFDLDQTLYPKSPEIDAAIQEYLYQEIALCRQCTREEAQRLFTNLYQEGKGLTGSQALQSLGVPRPKEIVQEALERADIAKFLALDPRTNVLLHRIRQSFLAVDLITGSTERIAYSKLQKLHIPRDTFNTIITGEIAKSDGSAFKLWLEKYPNIQPLQFLYVGDREKTDHVIPQELGIRTVLVNIKKPNPELHCLQLSTLHELENYLI